MRYGRALVIFLFAMTLSDRGYGQWGGFAQGVADAQQRDLERKHQLQMQREAEQTALEIARIQAQSRAAQTAQPVQAQALYWESGNAFVSGCAASLEKAEQPATETETDIFNAVACIGFLRGLEEGMNLGIQFSDANTKVVSPRPWCTPENATTIQAGLVLLKYIRAHPETAHQRTVLLALYAYRDAFSCDTSSKPNSGLASAH